MGSSSSKVASRAAGAARRQYPSAPTTGKGNFPNPTSTPSTTQTAAPARPPPSAYNPQPADQKSEHIDLDARDPHFGSALRRAGIARRVQQPLSGETSPSQQPFPTSSQPPAPQQSPPGQPIFPTSQAATNPAIAIVNARTRINSQYEQELENMGRRGFAGRTLLNAREIQEALRMQGSGRSAAEVERSMGLKPGILEQLGETPGRGVVENVYGQEG